MNYETWKTMTRAEREAATDNSDLNPMLVGLEGCRIECTLDGERVRFRVGKSTGWKPIHLRVHNSRSTGGDPIYGAVSDIKIIKGKYA